MKRPVITLAAFGLFIMLCSAGAWAAEAPAVEAKEAAAVPRMVAAQTLFSAGDVAPGSVISHDFIIKNEGAADLAIEEVVPNCGCSVADFDKVIAPGQSGKVTIKVNVYPDWAGLTLRKAAYVRSNDPRTAHTNLVIDFQVLNEDGSKPKLQK